MTDQPKRRGRPPKVRPAPPSEIELAVMSELDPPFPTNCMRIKAGTLQQAWQHATGTQWRPDWEDA